MSRFMNLSTNNKNKHKYLIKKDNSSAGSKVPQIQLHNEDFITVFVALRYVVALLLTACVKNSIQPSLVKF